MRNSGRHFTYGGELGGLDEAVLGCPLRLHPGTQLYLRGTQLCNHNLQTLVLVGAGDDACQNTGKRLKCHEVIVSKCIAGTTLYIDNTKDFHSLPNHYTHFRTGLPAFDGSIALIL